MGLRPHPTVLALLLVVAGCADEADAPAAPSPPGTDAAAAPGAPADPRAPGAALPTWALPDIQPVSDRFEERYGLDAFTGRVQVVALHAAWCSYCRSQAQRMEQVALELGMEGIDVQMVSVNAADGDAVARAGELAEMCTFPVFQDQGQGEAWAAMVGRKDDLYIYRPDGTLLRHIDHGQTPFSLADAGNRAQLRAWIEEAGGGGR
jgi:cytochrome oxidase Cu insertion factor (SCO1/SenC/PrrC family)